MMRKAKDRLTNRERLMRAAEEKDNRAHWYQVVCRDVHLLPSFHHRDRLGCAVPFQSGEDPDDSESMKRGDISR